MSTFICPPLRRQRLKWAWTLALVLTHTAWATPEPLSLAEAERLAETTDPGIARHREMADALERKAIADAELPDPQLRFALANFPTDGFRLDQEPMTQIQFGLQQRLPAGQTLRYQGERTRNRALGQRQRALERGRGTRQTTRELWFELFYWLRAEGILKETDQLFEQLVEVTQYQYGSGRRHQQDVVQAQLERSRIQDRLTEVLTMQDVLRARLAGWIGPQAAARPLPDELPELVALPDLASLHTRLAEHPRLANAQAAVQARQSAVAIAREAYKPGWMVGVTYGYRDGNNPNGSERPDFLSVGVTVDLPVFREKRQDQRLKAGQHQVNAARHDRDAHYLRLRSRLERDYAELQRLQERLYHYRSTLLPQAQQNAEVSLQAYRSDAGDLTALIRARIAQLDTRLAQVRLRVDQAKAHARLLYIAGEEP